MHRREYESVIFNFSWFSMMYSILDILNITYLGVCLVFENKQQ